MKIFLIGAADLVHRLFLALDLNGLGVTACISHSSGDLDQSQPLLKQLLESKGIPYKCSNTFSDAEADFVAAHPADVAFAIHCRTVISEKYLSLFPKGVLVTHASALPQFRGFSPLNWAILLGKKQFHISLFRAVRDLDAGPVLIQRAYELAPNASFPSHWELLVAEQVAIFLQYAQYPKNFEPGAIQNESNATYCCARTPEDGEINFQKTATEIDAHIRSLGSPFPYAFTYHKGTKWNIVKSRVKIPGTCPRYVGAVPGRVVCTSVGNRVEVLCGDGSILEILEVAGEHGPRMPAGNVFKSVRIKLGLNVAEELDALKRALYKKNVIDRELPLKNEKRVLLIIPAFNEQESIERTVTNVRLHFPKAEILIVNDASTDRTLATCSKLNCRIADLPVNLGIGGAVQTGLLFGHREGFDICVQFDGDGQHDSRFIQKLIDPIIDRKADLVIGSRFMSEMYPYTAPFFRRIGMRVFAFCFRLLTGQKITDSTSGFRAFSKEMTEFFSVNYPTDFPDLPALTVAKLNGFNIQEIPVQMHQRNGGQSSIRLYGSFAYPIKTIGATIAVYLRQERRK